MGDQSRFGPAAGGDLRRRPRRPYRRQRHVLPGPPRARWTAPERALGVRIGGGGSHMKRPRCDSDRRLGPTARRVLLPRSYRAATARRHLAHRRHAWHRVIPATKLSEGSTGSDEPVHRLPFASVATLALVGTLLGLGHAALALVIDKAPSKSMHHTSLPDKAIRLVCRCKLPKQR